MIAKKTRSLESVKPPLDLERALEEHTRVLRQTMEDIRDRTPIDGIRSRNCDGIVDSIKRLLADDKDCNCDCDCHQRLNELVARYKDH